jgi:hypothetical protein
MGLFSTPKPQAPKPTPPTPRVSDSEIAAKEESDKLRKRRGIEDQILSLGRTPGDGTTPRRASLLGRVGA